MNSFLAIAEELKLKGLTAQTSNDLEKDQEHPQNPKPVYKTKEVFVKPTAYTNSVKDELDENIHTVERIPTKASTALANPNQFNGDLQTLDEKVKSMMEKSQNLIPNGKHPNGTPKWATAFICKVCGKEGHVSPIRNHIEANHLEGISIICDHCGKVCSSRNALNLHKGRFHK